MSTSLRVWYSAVFAVGATAIAAGGMLAQPSSETASGHPVQAGVVLVSTNPTVSMKARASDAQRWQSKFSAVMGRLNDSLKAFNASAKNQDFAAMQESCGRLGIAARDMGATLPGPRKDLSDAIQGAVDDFLAAGSKCGTLTPEAGQEAVQSVLTDVQNGVAAMQNASAVMANANAPAAPETPVATPLRPRMPMGGI
jgi:hypothetical protein